MKSNNIKDFISKLLNNIPDDWINLTTHRLDIYEEEKAKDQFLEKFENLYDQGIADRKALQDLPTAYDYIRLGHPLSSVLEWAVGKLHGLPGHNVISFQSQTAPILAVLRKNHLSNTHTRLLYRDKMPACFHVEKIKSVYGYSFTMEALDDISNVSVFNGSTIFISEEKEIDKIELDRNIDFFVGLHGSLGSIMAAKNADESYISEIQHVRRRETVAMTPSNSLVALRSLSNGEMAVENKAGKERDKPAVLTIIKDITGTVATPLVASSGLSMQYAIMMGAIDFAQERYPRKAVKFIVPPNCYGGTNDQARRVAACLKEVEIVDLPVDRENDMVKSLQSILDRTSREDAIAYIIAEIPTNPRVEVPNLEELQKVLSQKRFTANGNPAVEPVFILDQTFCPDYQFLGKGEVLSSTPALSYASGSKFPSGGKCTAGYCVANEKTSNLMDYIAAHLEICDNEATAHQYHILAEQMPSMVQRINDAYENTRKFVDFIHDELPEAMINFVSSDLAEQGFTPSVFSIDLPTFGSTEEEREANKRERNLKLINLMIKNIPEECKFCVSYGQLKGSYWTIPATSTQGTTKEGDKDYIVRVSISPDLDLERHKEVFRQFVRDM